MAAVDSPRPGLAADPPAQPPESSEGTPTKLDVRAALDVAGYADSDHVFVLTPVLSGSVGHPTAGWSVGGQYLVDAVSAASVDIVATASQRWTELRHAGSIHAEYKPRAFGVRAQGSLSSEPDYVAWDAGLAATQDLSDQNITLLLGFDHGHDIAGRSGTSFDVFSRTLDREQLKVGVTLVVDPATLATFGLDADFEHGDPSKPYRYIPLFAPGTSVPNGASIAEVNRSRQPQRPLEHLPQTRDRYALSVRFLHRFDTTTLRVDERGYVDSWLLSASTTDARYLVDWGRYVELGPHVRIHAQKGALFWQRAYVLRPGFDFPALRTGDRELGPLVSGTLGATLRIRLGPRWEPDQWRLGLDIALTLTRYLNDLYITQRSSAYSALSLEAQL